MTVVAGPDGRLRAVAERKSWPLSGLGRPTRYSSSRAVVFDALQLSATYAQIYGSQPYIFALVNKLARGVARLPLKQFNRAANDARERLDPAHPLRMLIEQPFPRGSRFQLIEATVGNLCIYGNAAWWKYRGGPGKPPEELWPLDWRYMSFKSGDTVPVDHYEYDGPAGRRKFLADDIVHFHWWSPRGPQGTSPLEPLRETLALESAGKRYAISSFAHGARPSGAVVTPKTLDPKQKEELRDELQTLNAGPDNAFRLALLDGGMDWKPFGHTAQEAETIEHRKLNREEACAVYDVPPPVVHILDRATFSNVSEQNKALYRETMGPYEVMLEETIEAQLIRDELAFLGTYCEFDLAEVLKADLPQRAAAYKQMENTISINDRRRLENLPPIGDPLDETNPANGILMPLNMAIVLQTGDVLTPAAPGTAPPPDNVDPTALAAQLTLELERILLERAGQEPEARNGHDPDPAILALANSVVELATAQEGRPLELHIDAGAFEHHISAPEARVDVNVDQPTPAPALTPVKMTRSRILKDEDGNLVGLETEVVDA